MQGNHLFFSWKYTPAEKIDNDIFMFVSKSKGRKSFGMCKRKMHKFGEVDRKRHFR